MWTADEQQFDGVCLVLAMSRESLGSEGSDLAIFRWATENVARIFRILGTADPALSFEEGKMEWENGATEEELVRSMS